jgi:hypothetical protein
MSDLDKAKGLIARGDKEKALGLLASILIRNKDETEAWLLLGDTIDDPAKKKDCYNQVLRLFPQNLYALTKLQELRGLPPSDRQITNSKEVQIDNKSSINKSEQRSSYVPNQTSYPPANDLKGGVEVIGFVIGGIVAFLMILYVITSDSITSGESNILWAGLIFLGLITGVIILSASGKNRG